MQLSNAGGQPIVAQANSAAYVEHFQRPSVGPQRGEKPLQVQQLVAHEEVVVLPRETDGLLYPRRIRIGELVKLGLHRPQYLGRSTRSTAASSKLWKLSTTM